MKVADYMISNVITANLRDGLHQTFMRMRERNVRHMPVLGASGELVGIISERDIRRPDGIDTQNIAGYFALDNSMKVEDAMSSKLVTVTPDDSIRHALSIFINKKYGALPVVSDEGSMVGIISTVDLLNAFEDTLK